MGINKESTTLGVNKRIKADYVLVIKLSSTTLISQHFFSKVFHKNS